MAYVAPTELGDFENIFLRIPVYMHNVAAECVFRPSAWAAFGTADLESADYRACANFGPLYA